MRTKARLVVLALIPVLGCARRSEVPAPARITVGVCALRISLPVFLAADRGLFKKHGLDVDLKVYPTAQPMIDDLALGRTDAAGFSAYPIVFLGSQGARQPLVAATSLVEDRDHRLSYALARPGSGLRFPAGVRGRKIGILPTVAYQRWLDALLAAEKIGPQEVTVVPIAPPMQAQALAEGGVDLLFTNDPTATAMIAAGAAEIVDDGPPCARRIGEPFHFGTFVLGGPLASERPDVAARLVDAVDEAIAAVDADPAAARAAFAKVLRPEERKWVDRYPPSRYLASRDLPAGALSSEIALERRLGILAADAPAPAVVAWTPPMPR